MSRGALASSILIWAMACVACSEDTPPGLGDPHTRDLDGTAAGDHAFGFRGSEPGLHEIDHLFDSEAVRE
jgi:hypothetical protein